MFKWFKRKPIDYGTISIGAFGFLYPDGLPSHLVATCRDIVNRLSFYQDAMTEHARRNTSLTGILRLQEIRAFYHTNDSTISVIGTGNKFIKWHGKLEDFMCGNNLLIEQPQE